MKETPSLTKDNEYVLEYNQCLQIIPLNVIETYIYICVFSHPR